MASRIVFPNGKFESFMRKSFRDVFSYKYFTDVTLACEDGEQIQSHKFILSSISPVFRQIFLKNPHPHSLVYLTGVKYSHLQAIIQFVYLGQTDVKEEDLDGLIKTAKELKIEGLFGEHIIGDIEKEASTDNDKLDHEYLLSSNVICVSGVSIHLNNLWSPK